MSFFPATTPKFSSAHVNLSELPALSVQAPRFQKKTQCPPDIPTLADFATANIPSLPPSCSGLKPCLPADSPPSSSSNVAYCINHSKIPAGLRPPALAAKNPTHKKNRERESKTNAEVQRQSSHVDPSIQGNLILNGLRPKPDPAVALNGHPKTP